MAVQRGVSERKVVVVVMAWGFGVRREGEGGKGRAVI
jgi:hypothetical protein